jgi:ParB-like chromosome segregation protein Spo0J/DNA modification methylase
MSTLNVSKIELASIVIPDRLRRDSDDVREHIEQLARSIKDHGLICPIVLSEDNELIAGWCRTQAYLALGRKNIEYVTREKLSQTDRLILEVEENHRRLDMTWQEKTLGIYRAHRAASGKAGVRQERWSQALTGSLLNVSVSLVSDALKVAEYLVKEDKEVWDAASFDKAKQILARRKLDEVGKRLAQSSGGAVVVGRVPKGKPQPASMLTINLVGDMPSIASELDNPAPRLVGKVETSIIDLSDKLYLGDNREIFPRLKNSANVIFTDIPYGIDMDDLEDNVNIDMVKDEHDVEENLEQMPDFLKNSYDALYDDGWCIFYCAFQHLEKLRDWGEKVGFKVQPWPLLWIKPHSNKNNAPHSRFTKNIEPIMVMRKGKARLNQPMMESTKTADASAERKLQTNPFAKPALITKWIMEAVAQPGHKIIDCYAGQGSIVRALISLGMPFVAIEKKEAHFHHLTAGVKMTFKNLLGSNTEFINPHVETTISDS